MTIPYFPQVPGVDWNDIVQTVSEVERLRAKLDEAIAHRNQLLADADRAGARLTDLRRAGGFASAGATRAAINRSHSVETQSTAAAGAGVSLRILNCRRCGQDTDIPGAVYCDPCRPDRLNDDLMSPADWARESDQPTATELSGDHSAVTERR